MKNVLTIMILIGLILLSGAGTYVAVNYQSLFATKNYLTIDYFGGDINDAKQFKGLTLPFPEGTNYTFSWNVNKPLTADFILKNSTTVLVAAPGKVVDIRGYSNFSEIRINNTENTYLIYTIGGDKSVLSRTNSVVARGDVIGYIGNTIDNSKVALRIQVVGLRIDKSNFWASGEPKYFRS